MINVQSVSSNKSVISVSKASISKAAGGSFAEYFEVFSKNNPIIPDKWCLDTDKFGAGVDKAVQYMKENLGIDPYNREPTHEITDEQLKWIRSRHSSDSIYKTESGECNDGRCGWTMSWWDENFLSDLVYLNVISPEDAKSFGWIAFPESSSGRVCAASERGGGSDKLSVIDVASRVLKKQQSYIDSIYVKYNNDLSLMLKQDKEYLETAQKILEKNRILYEILLRLYD